MSTNCFYLCPSINFKNMEKGILTLQEIGRMMHTILRVFKKRSELQQYKEIKISPEQFGLLNALSNSEENVIQKDMAEILGKDKSAILRLIDSLEEKKLVRRVTDAEDRRKNCLVVTEVGNEVIDHYMKVVFEIMEEIQQGLSLTDLNTFHKVVNHITIKASNL